MDEMGEMGERGSLTLIGAAGPIDIIGGAEEIMETVILEKTITPTKSNGSPTGVPPF